MARRYIEIDGIVVYAFAGPGGRPEHRPHTLPFQYDCGGFRPGAGALGRSESHIRAGVIALVEFV
jgi:hypothetical protein